MKITEKMTALLDAAETISRAAKMEIGSMNIVTYVIAPEKMEALRNAIEAIRPVYHMEGSKKIYDTPANWEDDGVGMVLKRGDQIAYIPDHAEKNANHPDAEFGFVTSGPTGNGGYFCRYWRKGKIGELRTVANSQFTPVKNLVRCICIEQKIVLEMLAKYC